MKIKHFCMLGAMGLALSATPVLAETLSGGGSGGGAIQGGSGAPGSGTGVPGAIAQDTTAVGIAESDTPGFRTASDSYVAFAPQDGALEQHSRALRTSNRYGR